MNKRGIENKIYFMVGLLFMAVMSGLALFAGVGNFLDNTNYWKTFHARDAGLIMDVGLAGRGGFDIYYDLKFAKKPLAIALKDNHIELYDANQDEESRTIASFRFAKDDNIKINSEKVVGTETKIDINSNTASIELKDEEANFCGVSFNNNNKNNINIFINIEAKEPLKKEINNIVKNKLNSFNLIDKPDNADLALIIVQNEKENKSLYEGDTIESNNLLCNIQKKLQESSGNIFSNNFKLRNDPIWKKSKAEARITLILKLTNLNSEIAKSISQGVSDFYD